MLDRHPTLNPASLVTTWMEPQAERLIHDTTAVGLRADLLSARPSDLQVRPVLRWPGECLTPCLGRV